MGRYSTGVRHFRALFVLFAFIAIGATSLAQTLRDPSELKKLPPTIQRWYTLETKYLSREVRPGIFAPLSQNSQNPLFTPDQAQVFELKGYWIPEDEMRVFQDDLDPDLRKTFLREHNGKKEILFLVHPESMNFYSNLKLETRAFEVFLAAATASSRSLLIWKQGQESKPFIGKLSLDAVIANTDRTISGKETAMSVGVSHLLRMMKDLPASFGFFPEQMSAIPRGASRGGMILRPFPYLENEGRTLVPYFSIHADTGDGKAPLLARMIQRSGLRPREFVMKSLIEPFLNQWISLVVENGMTMEPHGQNALLEVDKTGQPTGRIFHRDFGGFNPDLDFISKKYGIKAESLPVFEGSAKENYYQDAHFKNIGKSLSIYFGDAVLFNISNNWSSWKQKGWITESNTGPFDVKAHMIRLLEKKLSVLSNSKVTLDERLTGIDDIVKQIQQQSSHPSCGQVYL